MAPVATDAIVLKAFPYGETSRIVRLLTRSAGVQSVIARGATRPRSPFAVLEPFAEGIATIYIRSTRELQTLAAFELTCSRHSLANGLLRFGGASLLAEIVMRTASEEAHDGLYHALADGLDRLAIAQPDSLEVNVLAATWRIIAELGFMPELDACIACGRSIDIACDANFDYAAGGLRCERCADGHPGRRIPAHARAALLSFSRGEPANAEITEGHWRLLTLYLEHHLLEGTPLRSLDFLSESLR